LVNSSALSYYENVTGAARLKSAKGKMIPVDSIMEAHTYYKAYGYSVLYNPLFGGAPQRKTFLWIHDANGHVFTTVFTDADKIAEVLR
jgi:hypothetical protein